MLTYKCIVCIYYHNLFITKYTPLNFEEEMK